MAENNVFSTPDNTVGNLNGLFKEVYADKLKDLIPDGVKVMNKVKFNGKDKQPGNLFHQPVILGQEHGITYADSDEDAFTLLPPVAGSIKDAQVRGNPKVLRSVLGYAAASRAAGGGSKAFEDATKYLIANMLRSMSKALEVEMIYGQMGLGVVASSAALTLVVTTPEWAPGIWAGAEGMIVEVRDITGATSRGTFTLSGVNMDTRVLTATTSFSAAGVVATDIIWRNGAFGKEFPGIHKILTQTTGTLFNINVGAYALWKGNQYPAGSAALSFTKLNNAAARAVEKGLDNGLLALVNPRGWSNILNDQAALRMYDQSYSSAKLDQGSQSIKFFSQNGEIEIEPSIYVKEGYAYLLSVSDWMRVGSQDVSFKVPGRGEDFFRQLENAAGYELRLYTDQAIFTHAPGKNVVITGVVNSA